MLVLDVADRNCTPLLHVFRIVWVGQEIPLDESYFQAAQPFFRPETPLLRVTINQFKNDTGPDVRRR